MFVFNLHYVYIVLIVLFGIVFMNLINNIWFFIKKNIHINALYLPLLEMNSSQTLISFDFVLI